MEKIQDTLKIEGMSCNHCVRTVSNALSALDGVQIEEVTIGAATVSYDGSVLSKKDLVEAVENTGFDVVGSLWSIRISISGLSENQVTYLQIDLVNGSICFSGFFSSFAVNLCNTKWQSWISTNPTKILYWLFYLYFTWESKLVSCNLTGLNENFLSKITGTPINMNLLYCPIRNTSYLRLFFYLLDRHTQWLIFSGFQTRSYSCITKHSINKVTLRF